MTRKTAFWDASALVPLCVHEMTSDEAQSHLRRFHMAVWWGSLVEAYSAVCRLYRQGEISTSGKTGAIARLRLLSQGWREILPQDEVRELAARLLDQYSIRAADSLQLAAALNWCGEHPGRRNFICGDRRLSEAAEAAGFSVIPLQGPVPNRS